jgi:phenylalanyl-tRNA synthetase beta chain
MAVIQISHPHLNELVGRELSVEQLEAEGSMLGVLFEDTEADKVDVEVEPNRPDLLSVEGLARALRGFFGIETGAVEYPVAEGDVEVRVDETVEDVRPHVACGRVTGLDIDEAALNSIIQLQEKLTETYGRKREKIAIGLHDMAPLTPPITYRGADPEGVSFVPLGRRREMTLEQIRAGHDKGEDYGWIVEGQDRYPLLEDSTGQVLSFPPVINGVVTEVSEATDDLFVDVTGTSPKEVETALNIVVAALYERGGAIESVRVDGRRLPEMDGECRTLDPDYVRDVSGVGDLSDQRIANQLRTMRYDADTDPDPDGDGLLVTVPSYRADVMHSYDIIEDVVIGYGYDNVEEELPDVATVGGESEATVFRDGLREMMVGMGGQECMTFILSNREKLFDRMEREHEPVVAMANPLTQDYTVIRNWLFPSLMQVLGDNQHNRYPQRLFEVGTCSVPSDEAHTGAEDLYRLAYASAQSEVGFSEVRGVLQTLAKQVGLDLAVEKSSDPSFADKRCGTILVDGDEAGVIGEVDDAVRANWEVESPVAGFEVDVAALADRTDG